MLESLLALLPLFTSPLSIPFQWGRELVVIPAVREKVNLDRELQAAKIIAA